MIVLKKRNFKIIYYKDNGTLPPEYHQEFVVKIHHDGKIKIKKLKGYEDQILFQFKGNLSKEVIDNIEEKLEKINIKENLILNKNPDKFGCPMEYMEIFYNNKIIKWHLPESIKEQDHLFMELFQKIQQIIKNYLEED